MFFLKKINEKEAEDGPLKTSFNTRFNYFD